MLILGKSKNLMEINFVWNNVWGKPLMNYMITELFGQKAYSNFKLHGNQFCVE